MRIKETCNLVYPMTTLHGAFIHAGDFKMILTIKIKMGIGLNVL